MYVEKVSLKNFRNFESLKLDLCNGVNVFYGDNAQGKTNFLEAVYCCSTGRSQRGNIDREMIKFSETDAHIQVIVRTQKTFDKIDVHLKKGDKKGVAINGLPIKKLGQLFGHLLTVIFSPEDLQLIKAGPSERRRFMDVELCQLSSVYYYELQQYYHTLKQRNNLLKNIKNNPSLRETIFVWDEQLSIHGIKIMEQRREFIERISEIAAETHAKLTQGKEKLTISYRPNMEANDFSEKLRRNIERDIILGSTSAGVHKDDICFLIGSDDARIYGSQGQQRTAALSAKLAEINLIKEQTENSPVLLLDDVLSELDNSRQKYFLHNMAELQTIITCTGIENVTQKITDNAAVFKVEHGEITQES